MNINRTKKAALTISIAGIALGLSGLQENIFFWMSLPVGAIFFIVFMIFMFLEKEYALLDEQNRVAKKVFTRLPVIKTGAEATSNRETSNKETCAPALTSAVSP